MSALIDEFLANSQVPGVVAVATSATETLYSGAHGLANVSTGEKLNVDTPHALFSMTKPLTSFAIMQLAEAGKVDLHASVRGYIDFAPEVLTAVDLEEKTFETEPLNRELTIHDLLTNTSGLGYAFCNPILNAFAPESNSTRFGLVHQPGEAWTYGTGTQILGEVIAAITGKSLEAALTDMIFTPLGMSNTSYEPQTNQARIHRRSDSGWEAQDLFPRMEIGDAGLIGPAEDYARFVRCLLNEGAPLVEPEMFREMTRNQIGDLFIAEQPACQPDFSHAFPVGAGIDKFGYGLQLHMAPKPGMRSPGSYSWCGVANTYFWGDPVKKVGGVVLMQMLPLYDPACLDTLDGFERRFYGSLAD